MNKHRYLCTHTHICTDMHVSHLAKANQNLRLYSVTWKITSFTWNLEKKGKYSQVLNAIARREGRCCDQIFVSSSLHEQNVTHNSPGLPPVIRQNENSSQESPHSIPQLHIDLCFIEVEFACIKMHKT